MNAEVSEPMIPEWSRARRPPETMVPALNALWDSGLRVVTIVDIEAVEESLPADRVAKTLRERGWLDPLRARGA